MSVLYIRDESGKFKAITTITGEKGEKGDPGKDFEYADFTPEQLEALRGPAGVAGPAGPVGPAGPKGEPGTPVVNEVLPDGIDAVSGTAVAAYVDVRVAQLGLYVLITAQPVPITVNAGEVATFDVEAVGKGLTYRWQHSTDGGISWLDSGEEGNNTARLRFIANNHNGYLYRCEITDANGNKAYTEFAMLTVIIQLKIITQPENITATSGASFTFAVGATGVATYQWQYSSNGSKFYDLPANDKWASATTDTLEVAVDEYSITWYYHCKLTGTDGSVLHTNVVKFTSPIIITKQPENQVAVAGDTVTFHVEAIGAVSYQWQVLAASGNWDNLSWEGAKTDTMTRTLNLNTVTYKYRCMLKAADGTVVYTNVVGFTSE